MGKIEPDDDLSESAENYLKAIYRLSSSDTIIKPKTLMEYIPHAPSTVTLILQRLAQKGYIEYQKYKGVRLTERGMRRAARVLRAHRLLEVFFFNFLKLDFVKVHIEACKAEHVFTSETIDNLEIFLNFPKKCPHGNPIPDKELRISILNDTPLISANRGTYYMSRVTYETEQVLDMLNKIKLFPGVMMEVIDINKKSNIVIIRANGKTQMLPFKIAKILNVSKEK